jgi:hypothetical protein
MSSDSTFGPATVALSNGRIVPNPLATTQRFAYATRGDGQLQADSVNVLNLRLTRSFALPFATVEMSASIFNLPNLGASQAIYDTDLTSSTFGVGASLQPARAAQIGVRLVF